MGPLGKYGQPVAAVMSLLIVVVDLGIRAYGALSGAALAELGFLDDLALVAVGAVFGSTSTARPINGSIAAVNRRLDAVGVPPAPPKG